MPTFVVRVDDPDMATAHEFGAVEAPNALIARMIGTQMAVAQDPRGGGSGFTQSPADQANELQIVAAVAEWAVAIEGVNRRHTLDTAGALDAAAAAARDTVTVPTTVEQAVTANKATVYTRDPVGEATQVSRHDNQHPPGEPRLVWDEDAREWRKVVG